jgi:hypothetical protein
MKQHPMKMYGEVEIQLLFFFYNKLEVRSWVYVLATLHFRKEALVCIRIGDRVGPVYGTLWQRDPCLCWESGFGCLACSQSVY